MKKGISRKDQNRAIRRDELRLYLAERGRLSHLFENIEKLEDLGQPLEKDEITRIKTANEQRLRLLDKYLPSMKSVEVIGDDGEPIRATIEPGKLSDETLKEILNARVSADE